MTAEAIDWINDQLRGSKDPLEKASMILNQANATISLKTMQLQSLEKDAFSNLPAVTAALKDLLSKTEVLKEKCSQCIIDPGENPELNELFMLDLVVSRMEMARNALKEVEKWTSFAIEMDAIFDSGEYEKAGKRLKDASESLDLLSVTVEYEERKKILEQFQNKLEENLYSKVIQNYSEKDLESMSSLYELYKCIQRETRFMQILNDLRARLVLEEWEKFDMGMHVSFESSFVQWNSEFLTQFVFESLVTDSSWIVGIFPNPFSFQLDYLGNVFIKLGTGLQERIMSMYEKNKSFSGIKDLYECFVSFGSSVEKYFLLLESNTSQDICDSGKWGLDLYKCFIPFQVNYADYERRNALEYLSVAISDNRKTNNYLDLVRVMPETVTQLLLYVENAFDRCGSLSLGLNTLGLVEALNDYFCGIVDRFSKILLQIRSETDVNELNPRQSLEIGEGIYSRQSSTEFEDFEIKNDDMGRQEWANFQLGLRILGINLRLEEKMAEYHEYVLNLIRHAEFKFGKIENFEGETWTSNESSLLSLQGSNLNSEDQWSKLRSLKSKECVFETSLREINSFSVKSQKYIYDTLFMPINRQLSSLTRMDIWNSTSLPNPSPFDLELPSFSLSPLEYITRIGEHLLCLPQQLDLYMDDPSLSLSLSTLPWIDESTLSSLRDEENAIDTTHVWITSICRGTFTLYLETASSIKSLSKLGRSQLHTDMGYLINILSAMDIEPSQSFSEFQKTLIND